MRCLRIYKRAKLCSSSALTYSVMQAEALNSVPGTVTKNLFLKVSRIAGPCAHEIGTGNVHGCDRIPVLQDKKKRLYVVTAVPSTKIDLKGGHPV